MKKNSVKSAVYLLKYSDTSIKIGMSDHLDQRLQSYQGYQSHAQSVQALLVAFTKKHKLIEQESHKFASTLLNRIGDFEVFEIPIEHLSIDQFVDQFEEFLNVVFNKDIAKIERNYKPPELSTKRKDTLVKQMSNL